MCLKTGKILKKQTNSHRNAAEHETSTTETAGQQSLCRKLIILQQPVNDLT
jgi:hypothetical protein